MYFKSIEIENYGCISNFNYHFRFDKDGNPIPCVLIGENGKGKTLVLANMVDFLIEAKRKVYGEKILETIENKYFKVGNKNYIKSGATYSRVKIEFEHDDKISTLFDIMSKNRVNDILRIQSHELNNIEKFKENGFSKKVVCQLKKNDFDNFLTLYFPVDRYYYPMWFNKGNHSIYHPSYDSDINTPNYNLIKTDLFTEIQEWLIEIYLEKNTQLIQLPDTENFPEQLRGQFFPILLETPMQKIVSRVLEIIKGNQVNSPQNFNRKNKMLGFSSSGFSCYDISQFSDGEMNLFCIAMNIVKEWDSSHSGVVDLNQIAGCVLIDEADSGMHIDYAYRALPKLMKMFPKVQFILTSHSPFFLSGLQNEYGENIDILNMPEGIKIDDIAAFDEIKKAQDIFMKSVNELREKNKELKSKLQEIQTNNNSILIFTEGETDVILLEKAMEKLGITDLNIKIQAASTFDNNHSDSVLKTLLENIQSNNRVNNNIIIGMFDRDAEKPIKFKGVDNVEHVLNDEEYLQIGTDLYAFSIPVPRNRPETNQISIEHYFTDEEIKTYADDGKRLFLGKEFYKNGNHMHEDYNYRYIGKLSGTIKVIEHQTDKVVTDKKGEGDYSLSKSRFANNIKNDVAGFDNFDFSEFNKIFNVVRQITIKEGALE